VRNAVRTGLGIKVFGLLAAMAATGAAAVGVSQVAQHEPEPPKTVVVPAVPSAVPDSPTSGPDDDPSTTAPATRPRPHVTPTASPTPRVHRPHPAGPAPIPRPSSHESEAPDPPAPEASDQPGPTTDAADTRSVESAPAD
jgi:hypothetical protein